MAKAADRAAQLKARMTQERAHQVDSSPPVDDRATRAHFVGATVLEQLTTGRNVQAVHVTHIAPELRVDLRQPRLLPLPEELRLDGEWDEAYRDVIDELLALGRSLQERQIHPIVIYPGTSTTYPTAQYVIAAGHRRWTAAVLSGLPTIDAMIIDPPTPADLVDIQYTENEDRSDFSDMERAWALARMKHVLQDAPWDVVEQRFRLSEGRRKQLMRLLAFSPPQQQLVARMRASETQLRPLHAALRDGTLTTDQADRIFQQLITRIPSQPQESTIDASSAVTPTPPAIDSRTVTQLLTRVQRSALPPQPTARPKWLDPLHITLAQARKGLYRLPQRVEELDDTLALELQGELDQLLTAMTGALESLQKRTDTQDTRIND